MYTFWMFWALVVGALSTSVTDDWSRPVTKSVVRGVLGFIFAGVGIPIISTLAWPPTAENLQAPEMMLAASVGCLATYAIGWFAALTVRRFQRKYLPPAASSQ